MGFKIFLGVSKIVLGDAIFFGKNERCGMAILVFAILVTGIDKFAIRCVLWNITCSMLVWGLKFFWGSLKLLWVVPYFLEKFKGVEWPY